MRFNFQVTFHLIFLIVPLLLGCSDLRLVHNEPVVSVKSEGQFCLSDPTASGGYTKFLFLVDKSGSNIGEGREVGTDPGAYKRGNNIKNFIENYRDDNFVKWGMIGFHNPEFAPVIIPYIHDESNEASFVEGTDLAIEAANEMMKDSDGGSTPYMSALSSAGSIVQRDLDLFPEESTTYVIFFISDGEPTDTKSQSELEGSVEKLVGIAPGQIVFSTAFYGSDEDEDSVESPAVALLGGMAEAGDGIFVNFEESSDWDFGELIPQRRVYPWLLKKFLVYNVNAGYCINGSVDVDSDSDGMCDKDEIVYGFDPTDRFTHGDGYGDYFHWRKEAYGEVLPPCTDQTDKDRDLLTACEEAYIENHNPPEGVPHNGDPENPDTDQDGVIDGVEIFVYFQRSLAYAMDSGNLARSPFDGEEDAETQIDEHRNPLVRDKDRAVPYDTNIVQKPPAGRDCYEFSQQILPLYETLMVAPENTLSWLSHGANENSILVYYIQTPKDDPSDKGVYRYSYQKLLRNPDDTNTLGPKSVLEVSDRIFQTYVTP